MMLDDLCDWEKATALLARQPPAGNLARLPATTGSPTAS